MYHTLLKREIQLRYVKRVVVRIETGARRTGRPEDTGGLDGLDGRVLAGREGGRLGAGAAGAAAFAPQKCQKCQSTYTAPHDCSHVTPRIIIRRPGRGRLRSRRRGRACAGIARHSALGICAFSAPVRRVSGHAAAAHPQATAACYAAGAPVAPAR